MELINNY